MDLYLGGNFKCWDEERLKLQGSKTLLNLAEQKFPKTADAFLRDFPPERDGSYVLPLYWVSPAPVLAMTRERVHLKLASCLAARVEGRSSLVRLGLMVHLTAPTIHAGFGGQITLEMVNHGPFYLQLIPDKTPICQLIIDRLETKPLGEIRTEFQGQDSPGGREKGSRR